MDSHGAAQLYDSFYFTHYSGRPYQRDEVWLQFFATIADRVVSDIRPCTVLDAGCAMGFLVEALRDRGVNAGGIDISEYAIEQVRPDIRTACWVGSVVDPFPQAYDLLMCIEVLEHLSPGEAEPVIANFCQHTTDILFSSTPFDYKDVTHLNVRPPDYWAELFARHGFFHDVDFDASFISPWAVRFRCVREPVARIVAAYERRLWQLEKDNQARRELTLEQRRKLAALQAVSAEINERDQRLQALNAEVNERDQRLQAVQAEVSEQDQRLQALSAVVMKRDQRLQVLSAEVNERDQRLQALSAEVNERDQRLQALSAEVSERDQRAQALSTQVMELNQQVQKLSAERAEQVQALNTQVAERDQQIQRLNAQVAAQDWQVRVIESDYGWRLLRKVKGVRLWLVPGNSRRERWYLYSLRFVYLGMFAGPSSLLRRGLARVQRRTDHNNSNNTSELEKNGTSLVSKALLVAPEVSVTIAETERPSWGKRVLVINGSTGDMERYRCHHLREQLQLFGIGCEVRSFTDPQVMALLPDYKLIILHRVAYDQWMEHLIATAHKVSHATVVFDIDDLVFRPELDEWIHVLRILPLDEQALFREGMQRYQRMVELCDGVLAATEPIAEAARRMGKPAWIHRNALSLEMLALSEQAYHQRVPVADKVVLGYASGTRTHNRDFAEAEPALERILRKYPQTELWIIGHLDLDHRWNGWAERVKRIPFMPWRQLPGTLARLDINLAPLEVNNPFCASPARTRGPRRRSNPACRHGPAVRSPRRLVAGGPVGRRRRGRRQLPRRRPGCRTAARSSTGAPRAGGQRRAVRVHPRGCRSAADAPRVWSRPPESDTPVARPARHPGGLPVRAGPDRRDAARTSSPRRSWPGSAGRSKGFTGPDRPGRVDSPRMRDLFDDFMEELRKPRGAGARARMPARGSDGTGRPTPTTTNPTDDGPSDADASPTAKARADGRRRRDHDPRITSPARDRSRRARQTDRADVAPRTRWPR